MPRSPPTFRMSRIRRLATFLSFVTFRGLAVRRAIRGFLNCCFICQDVAGLDLLELVVRLGVLIFELDRLLIDFRFFDDRGSSGSSGGCARGHQGAAALLDARRLTGESAQVIELRAAD